MKQTKISIKKKLKAAKVDDMLSVKPDEVKEARAYMAKLSYRFSSDYENNLLILTRTA